MEYAINQSFLQNSTRCQTGEGGKEKKIYVTRRGSGELRTNNTSRYLVQLVQSIAIDAVNRGVV